MSIAAGCLPPLVRLAEAAGKPPADEAPALAGAAVVVDLTDLKALNAESRSIPAGPESAAAWSSAQQSAAMNPGYDPVGGLVGVIIGIQLTQSLQRSADQTRANEPIAGLRQQYDEGRATLRLEAQLLAALQRQDPAFGACVAEGDDRRNCKSRLQLRPRVTVGCTYRCIDVGLKVRWVTVRGKELYRNEFGFQSDLLPPTQAEGEAWARDDMAALRAALAQATETLAGMLVADLATGRVNLNPKDSETLRYRNEMGVFHERGQLVREDAGRWLIRSIGGGLRSMPAGQRLTSEEYYQFLSGPPSQPPAPGPDVAPAPDSAALGDDRPAIEATVTDADPAPVATDVAAAAEGSAPAAAAGPTPEQ
ncbi:MAG: hypothetical protein J0M16_04265 [Gammaproteobacteria bacterium]|nr:hypothetical protein [Gammaproteobacteria bacterium]